MKKNLAKGEVKNVEIAGILQRHITDQKINLEKASLERSHKED